MQPNPMENLIQQPRITQYFNLLPPNLGFPVKYQATHTILCFSAVQNLYFPLALVDAETSIV